MNNLKKIKVRELRLGMFLNGFDGAWLQHPFWKTKFLLLEPADLLAAHGSSVAECWIDIEKGEDVAPPVAVAPAAAAPRVVLPEAPALPPVSASFGEEMQRAAKLCRKARDATASMFNEARLGNAIDPEQCVPLVTEIAESMLRNPGALISLARLKTSDDYTYMHSVAVCALMVSLGRALGMDEEQCRDAGLAGLLHDIGKATISNDILNKPGKLTSQEFDSVKRHPVRGYELLVRGDAANAAALDVCLHHHEKYDGSGYPDKLAGEDISLMARMGAVCDVYDAITSNRPYKSGWDPAESVAQMISWKGHFDQKILSAFIKTLGIYPTGALVRMDSGRLAVVLEQNPAQLTKPVVKVFFSTKSDTYIPVERIDLSQKHASDRIAGREPREKWTFVQIDELWAGEFAPVRANG
ncbi:MULTISPECIES: HD-GYP domain-containing protein [unclassified Janthinobacterium]|uniref:HD-GYP domain-containing protein n=1 Tax=unclassified Janthinobacterium TaxID=2610881 RepID=UPI000381ADC9|nr:MULTISPECIES: HD-GYP domain-containing protein [unclassified Janthinobacterium]MEC5163193.1 HD-GYP domain-containing protein (c-di-GMP phosphodiesterase class II) [Janthinobacterium sp. CG_S6]